MSNVRVRYRVMNISNLATGAYLFVKRILARSPKGRELELELVRTSAIFDPDWYCREYADVGSAAVDPAAHYLDLGWREGRDPGPEFSTSAYLRANADVAKSGKNPLVHYVEFGQFEGREAFGHRPSYEDRPIKSFDFPEGSPCFSSAVEEIERPDWLSHIRLDGRRPDACFIESHLAGYLRDAAALSELQSTVGYFKQICGYGGKDPSPNASTLFGAPQTLADAWFTTTTQLRTRWKVGAGSVVRAYQVATSADGSTQIVAEDFIQSELDLVDLPLENPFFPILFLFVEPNGEIVGARILAFPSLCRGGAHYAELLERNERAADWMDPFSRADLLAESLRKIIVGEFEPAIVRLAVDLDGADGSAPMFRPDFKLWLEKVGRVSVLPHADDGHASQFLVESVKVDPDRRRVDGDGTLVLQHDMIPTLSSLVAPLEAGNSGGEPLFMPLIVANRDPAQPALRMDHPNAESGSAPRALEMPPQKWPSLENAPCGQSSWAGAIRITGSVGLADAELFFPTGKGSDGSEFSERGAITWMIEAQDWDQDQLLWAIEVAFSQDGGGSDVIAFIGQVPQRTLDTLDRAFPRRIVRFKNPESAAADATTEFLAYLGSGIILHDLRCATSLSRLLNSDEVATASCVLLSVDQRGKAWNASIAWDGISWATSGSDASLDKDRAVQQLWGSTYVVAAPPPDFWVTRSSQLRRWMTGPADLAGAGPVHLCSAAVTASLMDHRPRSKKPAFMPRTQDTGAAVTKVMIG